MDFTQVLFTYTKTSPIVRPLSLSKVVSLPGTTLVLFPVNTNSPEGINNVVT